MKNCCICNTIITDENAPILCVDQKGNFKELCDECANKIEIIENDESPAIEKISSLNYLISYLDKINDPNVKTFINNLINPTTDYSNISDESTIINNNISYNGSIWIKGLKIIVWIVFIGLIITGIILGSAIDDALGFLIFLGFLLGGFLLTAIVMSYLDIGSDVREIKNILSQNTK